MASSRAWRLGAAAAPEEERVAAAEETKRVHLLLDDAPAFRANTGPIATDLGTGFYGTAATVSSGLVLDVTLYSACVRLFRFRIIRLVPSIHKF